MLRIQLVSLDLSDFLITPISREQSMISWSSKNLASLLIALVNFSRSSSSKQIGALFLKSLSFLVDVGSLSVVSLPYQDPLISYLSTIFSLVLKTLAIMTKQLLQIQSPLSFFQINLCSPKNLVMRVSGFCLRQQQQSSRMVLRNLYQRQLMVLSMYLLSAVQQKNDPLLPWLVRDVMEFTSPIISDAMSLLGPMLPMQSSLSILKILRMWLKVLGAQSVNEQMVEVYSSSPNLLGTSSKQYFRPKSLGSSQIISWKPRTLRTAIWMPIIIFSTRFQLSSPRKIICPSRFMFNLLCTFFAVSFFPLRISSLLCQNFQERVVKMFLVDSTIPFILSSMNFSFFQRDAITVFSQIQRSQSFLESWRKLCVLVLSWVSLGQWQVLLRRLSQLFLLDLQVLAELFSGILYQLSLRLSGFLKKVLKLGSSLGTSSTLTGSQRQEASDDISKIVSLMSLTSFKTLQSTASGLVSQISRSLMKISAIPWVINQKDSMQSLSLYSFSMQYLILIQSLPVSFLTL